MSRWFWFAYLKQLICAVALGESCLGRKLPLMSSWFSLNVQLPWVQVALGTSCIGCFHMASCLTWKQLACFHAPYVAKLPWVQVALKILSWKQVALGAWKHACKATCYMKACHMKGNLHASCIGCELPFICNMPNATCVLSCGKLHWVHKCGNLPNFMWHWVQVAFERQLSCGKLPMHPM